MVVIDASVIVAALVDTGSDGRWAEALIADETLVAPHLMPFEAGNILRRLSLAGQISTESGKQALADLVDLPITLYPFEPLAGRVWSLRENASVYDASYVALAEALEAPLATLDRKLARTPGADCGFRTPSAGTL